MSETAAERPTRSAGPPSPAPGGGNILQRKIGPLPGWAWAGLAGVGALAWWYFRNRSGQAAADASAGEDANAAVGDDVQGQLSTIQTEIQNLQGEESQEGSTTPANSGTGTSPAPVRHESTGKETLNQIAKSRHTSVAHIVAVSKASPESKDNLAKLLSWAAHPGTRRKGVVYYTAKGPVQGATA